VKYEKIVCERASNFRDIVGGELTEGIQHRLVSDRSFNAITVVEYLLKSYKITELYVVVYRMNNTSFDYLRKLIEADSIKAGFVVSTFFEANKKYERWAKEIKILSETAKNVRTAFYNSHAKVFMAKTACGKHIVFEGSGNLTTNSKIEQYIFENNKQVYEFHKQWIEAILKVNK
jgi:hypothetical protein